MRGLNKQSRNAPGNRKSVARVVVILIFICGIKALYPAAHTYAAGVSPAAVAVYGQASSFTTGNGNSGGISINSVGYLRRTSLDSNGNLYVSDTGNNRVLYFPAGSQSATRVYGQNGSFISNSSNNGGISANTLFQPYGIVLDSSNDLYVADQNNNRVLYYPAGSTTATRVYGQFGSFTSSNPNNGGTSANSLSLPTGVALDSSGNLYIADQNNSRVLYYPSGSTTATRIYGQSGSFTTGNGSVSINGLNQPTGVVLDSSNDLYVADYGNNRVLYYPVGSTAATRVYGQGGSFTSNTSNNGGVSANSLYQPFDVNLDGNGNLYVADYSNNRVLYYSSGSTTATRVYGQFGSFTLSTSNNGGISANSLSNPSGVALDSSGNLYITDYGNNRVLYYPAGSTTATRVIGQSGFTTNVINNGGISPTSLSNPAGLALDSSGNLYLADYSNNRVLYYPAGSTTATRVYGQSSSFTTNTFNNGGISANSLASPSGVALDSSGNLYITDYSNNRVLYYPAGSTMATRVYGQSSSFTTNTPNNGGLSAKSLSQPSGVALDSSGNLYVADYGNNRVLYYPAGSTAATRVYGQAGSFIVNGPNNGGTSANSLANPSGVALDSSGNLYVADYNNNRVLYYPAGSTTATRVYGQNGSFSSSNSGVSASALSKPTNFALDSSSDLYIADNSNNRVLYYPSGSTSATRVYGQFGNFTSANANSNGISANSLDQPIAIAADSSGNVYVSDNYNNRVLAFQTSLSISSQPPTSTAAGSSFGTTASLVDVGSGSVFSDFTGTIAVAIKSGTGTSGAVLSGTSSSAAVNGVATFSNLSINLGGTGYVLTLSSPGLGSATTNSFAITGVTGKLLFIPLTVPTFTFTLTGSSGTVTSQRTLRVSDTTGSGVGWHVDITSTQFVSGTNTLPTTALTITGVTTACTSGQTCVLPVNGVKTYPITVPAATTEPAAISYFSANGNTGTGDVTLTVNYALTIPPGTASGIYTSTLTETVLNASSYYNIINENSGLYADVNSVSLSDGATVIQYPANGGLNQQWQLIDVGGGYDKIIAHHSGKALDVQGSSLTSGATIVQNTYTGATSQQWQIVIVSGSYAKIVNRNSGLVFDVPGGVTYVVTLDQSSYTGATSQLWQFAPLP